MNHPRQSFSKGNRVSKCARDRKRARKRDRATGPHNVSKGSGEEGEKKKKHQPHSIQFISVALSCLAPFIGETVF